MTLVKCENGHFYDENRFEKCPHCNRADVGDNVTVAAAAQSASSQTVSLQDAVNSAVGSSPAAPPTAPPAAPDAPPPRATGDDQKTVSFFKKTIGTEPVVGWLVCVEGAHFGEDFRLKSGRNFIGRGGDMDVVLSKDNTVSRERHAVVVYEPKGNVFLIAPGDSSELFYMNDEVVLMPKEINQNDNLTVGNTKLMFVPCCGPNFNWDSVKKEERT